MIVGANMPWQYIQTESGLILPWYTLSCLEWLVKQDVSQWNVFEYGAGYSTRWWTAFADIVVSIDNSEVWAKAMTANYITDKNDFIDSAKDFDITGNGWDCIIIDGAWRLECLQNSFDRVASGGYIIIDNWSQEDFPYTKEAEELLVGWEKQLFKQPNHSKWITAVFRKP